MLGAELELLNTNVSLWRELTDDVFERHFRQRYFGNESISRQQAIDRLVAMGAKCPQHAPVHAAAAPEAPGLSAVLTGLAEPPENGVSSAGIKILVLPRRELPWRSMLLSILAHGLILSSLLSVRLPQRRTQIIDFETATITYYKVSESLPNVAPKQQNELPHHALESKAKAGGLSNGPEVRIRPMNSERNEMVIEQPNVVRVLALRNYCYRTFFCKPRRWIRVVNLLSYHPMFSGNWRWMFTNPSHSKLTPNSTQALATRQPVLPLPQIAALPRLRPKLCR